MAIAIVGSLISQSEMRGAKLPPGQADDLRPANRERDPTPAREISRGERIFRRTSPTGGDHARQRKFQRFSGGERTATQHDLTLNYEADGNWVETVNPHGRGRDEVAALGWPSASNTSATTGA